MSKKNTISISEARKRIFEIADEVQKPGGSYILTEKGKPKAVIMSFDRYDDLLDDLDILSDPTILENIKKAEAEYRKGEYYTWEEVQEELGWTRKKEWAVAEKPKKPYAVKKRKGAKKKGL